MLAARGGKQAGKREETVNLSAPLSVAEKAAFLVCHLL
jgi:hypothetical protein